MFFSHILKNPKHSGMLFKTKENSRKQTIFQTVSAPAITPMEQISVSSESCFCVRFYMAWQEAKKTIKRVFVGVFAVLAAYIVFVVVQDVIKKVAAQTSAIEAETRLQQSSLLGHGCKSDSIDTDSFFNDDGDLVVETTGKDDEGNTYTIRSVYDSDLKLKLSTLTVKDKDGETSTYVWDKNLYDKGKGGWKKTVLK